MKRTPHTDRYRIHRRRLTVIAAGLGVLALALAILSLFVGAYELSCAQLIAALGGWGDAPLVHILRDIRLPRAAAALVAGAGLGASGLALQGALRNPLASPYTLGISQGAAFGAAFAIIALGAGGFSALQAGTLATALPGITIASALFGALATAAVIILLSRFSALTPGALILVGVALASLFTAGTMFLQYIATDVELAAAIFWTFGDIGRARWVEVAIMATVIVPAILMLALRHRSLDALLWGDDAAASMGVHVHRLRMVLIAIASLMAAIATAFLGVIGFVGLIGPHLARLLVGEEHRVLLPASIACSAGLLIIADCLARMLLAPVTLPVGIFTAFAGAPLFIALLLKRRGVTS